MSFPDGPCSDGPHPQVECYTKSNFSVINEGLGGKAGKDIEDCQALWISLSSKYLKLRPPSE